MTKRLILVVCLFFPLVAFAGDKHIVRFNNDIPASFAAAVEAAGGTLESQHDGAGIAVVAGLTDDAAAALARDNGAAEAIADAEIEVRPGPATVNAEDEAYDDVASPSNPATAFFYARQWHLRAIGAQHAWAAGRGGSANVTVAVLDTGISYTHPDLAGRVDLSRSKSFVPSDD